MTVADQDVRIEVSGDNVPPSSREAWENTAMYKPPSKRQRLRQLLTIRIPPSRRGNLQLIEQSSRAVAYFVLIAAATTLSDSVLQFISAQNRFGVSGLLVAMIVIYLSFLAVFNRSEFEVKALIGIEVVAIIASIASLTVRLVQFRNVLHEEFPNGCHNAPEGSFLVFLRRIECQRYKHLQIAAFVFSSATIICFIGALIATFCLLRSVRTWNARTAAETELQMPRKGVPSIDQFIGLVHLSDIEEKEASLDSDLKPLSPSLTTLHHVNDFQEEIGIGRSSSRISQTLIAPHRNDS